MTTNKIYETAGTPKVFMNTGGNITFTLKNLTAGSGRVSDQWDRGAGSHEAMIKWEACMKWAATPALGDLVRIYMYVSETAAAAADYAADAAITPETLFGNFTLIGQCVAKAAAVGPFYASGLVEVRGRYVVLGVWQTSAVVLENTDSTSKITLTPFSSDIQAAA